MPSSALTRRKKQYQRLSILINGAYSTTGRDAELVGKGIGVSRASVYNYLKAPETMPLDKFIRLCKWLGIPAEEIREYIQY